MHIVFWIVTYDNNVLLNNLLKTLFDKTLKNEHEYKVIVMDNYGNGNVDECFNEVILLKNVARPSFSTGHLSRSWNQGIMHAFVDVDDPHCDLLVLIQSDTLLLDNYFQYILDNLNKFDYMTFGTGDQVQVMTPMSIKKIGLFDERFCGTGFQEGDYFLRAVLLNRERSTINDPSHGRMHNAIEDKVVDKSQPTGWERDDPTSLASAHYHYVSHKVFNMKWGNIGPSIWNFEQINTIKEVPKQYMYYPYFETKLPDLSTKYF